MKEKFYFTFGRDPQYPYGIDDYVVVEAKGYCEACSLFNMVHPPREGSDLINCAFIYSEKQFMEKCAKYYPDIQPKEVISLNVKREDEQ